MTSVEVEGGKRGRDEIADYRDLRSVGSCEAAWHLYGYPISHRYPAVIAMRVHNEDEQYVVRGLCGGVGKFEETFEDINEARACYEFIKKEG